MTTQHLIVAPGDVVTDITDRVRLPSAGDNASSGFAVAAQAEEGGVGSSDIIIDDPDGDITIYNGQNYRIVETDSESDDPYLYSGAFGAVRVIRGPHRTGVARQWACGIVDGNSALDRYIFRPDENANRPAETCGARGAWLLTTVPLANMTDHRYFDVADPTPLPKEDFTRQTARQVLDNMAQQSGHDFGAIFRGDVEAYAPIYLDPESDLLDSDIRLTNIIEEVEGDDDGNTFYVWLDAELVIDDDRMASGILAVGDGIETWAFNTATATTYGRRDLVMDAPDIDDLGALKARARRWVTAAATPDITMKGRVQLPNTKASMLKEAFRVQVKMSHMPGLQDDWVWCRVLMVNIQQVNQTTYRTEFELGLPIPATPVQAVQGAFQGTGGLPDPEGGDVVHYANTGDSPGPGWPLQPTMGDIEALVDPTPVDGNRTYYGWKINGTGTIDVTFHASVTGVTTGEDATITWAIRLNGAVVESDSEIAHAFTGAFGAVKVLTATALDVEPDDVITATIRCTPNYIHFFRTPGGIGVNEGLYITGGELA